MKLNLSPRCPSSMLQDKKRQNKKRNTAGCAPHKHKTTLYCTPALAASRQTLSLMSAWRTRFDVARKINKKTNKPRQTQQGAHRKRKQPCTAPLALTASQQTLSCLPGAPASMLREKKTKKQTNQDKHDRKRTAKKENNHVLNPPPHYVVINSLMSAWRTRSVECAAIIDIFAFVR